MGISVCTNCGLVADLWDSCVGISVCTNSGVVADL